MAYDRDPCLAEAYYLVVRVPIALLMHTYPLYLASNEGGFLASELTSVSDKYNCTSTFIDKKNINGAWIRTKGFLSGKLEYVYRLHHTAWK